MNIAHVHIQNFRKLKQCRIDFSGETTMFVGANNSGKTSAMDALGKFLAGRQRFSFNDFTICNHAKIRKTGEGWIAEEDGEADVPIDQWNDILPALDFWLNVENTEIQYVAQLIPTLDWTGGLLGVRFLFQPKDISILRADFLEAYSAARKAEGGGGTASLWPKNLCDYLERKLYESFTIKAYILDPAQAQGNQPQPTDFAMECMNQDPLRGLIQIDMIEADRELSGNDTGNTGAPKLGKLSDQLQSYYKKHLDPEVMPTSEDIAVLSAMEQASSIFNDNLTVKFGPAIQELQQLGYPGVNDPDITVMTKISAVEALRHDSAVQYSLGNVDEEELRLPEQYNGLGYQNLISIVFRLMQFRDGWIQAGKAKPTTGSEDAIAPLHLVLLEEPEAHLHVQVQQVFIREAYKVLRNATLLQGNCGFKTQLIVSTHSSHIAKEANFADLRYFKRLCASESCGIATAEVINLNDVFGGQEETEKFVTRYLKTMHCDLFFADAAVLVEGSAESMLLPHFIRNHFEKLSYRYITVLSIDGRHSYRLRPLLDKLCLTTLVITDIDSVNPDSKKSVRPVCGQKLISSNYAITSWLVKKALLDDLFDLPSENKVFAVASPYPYKIRIAYQTPIEVDFRDGGKALPRTFEDSIIYSNIDLFMRRIGGEGLVDTAHKLLMESKTLDELQEKMYEELRKKSTDKAGFALDLIYSFDPIDLAVPQYIEEGLTWLQTELGGEPSGGQ